MKIIVSMTLLALLVVAFSPCLTTAQDDIEKSPTYLEAWGTTDLGVRVEKLNQAIREKPDMLAAHYYLGLTLSQLKRYDEAAAAYQRLIQIPAPPTDPSPRFLLAGHYELGKIFIGQSKYEAAASQYRWLNERKSNVLADELALFLSDLFPKQAAEQYQVPISQMFAGNNEPAATNEKQRVIPQMTATSKITILHKEKAMYTEIARINKVQGTVVLRAVFTEDGAVTNIEVIRGVPDGLTRRAIEAAQGIRFQPATNEGKPMTVRGHLEFTFNLY